MPKKLISTFIHICTGELQIIQLTYGVQQKIYHFFIFMIIELSSINAQARETPNDADDVAGSGSGTRCGSAPPPRATAVKMRTWNCLPRVMFNQWLFQILLAILLGNVHKATASPEPGKWEITFDNVSSTTKCDCVTDNFKHSPGH